MHEKGTSNTTHVIVIKSVHEVVAFLKTFTGLVFKYLQNKTFTLNCFAKTIETCSQM
jgi:hypothetical protein